MNIVTYDKVGSIKRYDIKIGSPIINIEIVVTKLDSEYRLKLGVIYLNLVEFLKTIYFGDRFCKNLIIDKDNSRVELYINQISRIRDRSREWKYYLDEDIENGAIVITGVQKIFYDESGLFPNDQIYDVYATELGGGIYQFVIETSYVDEKALTHDLTFKVIGKNVYIFDPKNPLAKICK